MPSAWTQNYYHAVFSTKNRQPLITPDLEERLHPFIGGIIKDLGATPIAINGAPDHIHALVRYPADLCHSDLLRHIKGRSSKWLHETFPNLRSLSWQEGYGGFTVSASQAPKVEDYIRRQKEHHRRQSFEDEIMELLRKHGIEASREEVLR